MRKLTNEEFIKKCKSVHGDKYDYSLTKYVNTRTKVKIICHIHGIFKQMPSNHIYNKQGCLLCDRYNHKMITNNFIVKSNIIHNNKYNYSLTKYDNSNSDVIIICEKHGSFKQRPFNHLNGHGCPLCKSSNGEKKIIKILKDNNINFITQKSFNGCVHKRKLKFDFYLTDKNICIEYDGIQHFISKTFFGGDKYLKDVNIKDNIKNNYCIKNNIKLLRIKYTDDIKNKIISHL